MSVFRYNSNHKVFVGILVVLVSAAGFYLRDREKPSYDNGQSKQVGGQVDGRNHGLWVWYYPNGKKKMQGKFKHGEREGVWVTFSLSGDTLSKANYHNDKLNGKYSAYGDGNKILETVHFKDDKLVSTSEAQRQKRSD